MAFDHRARADFYARSDDAIRADFSGFVDSRLGIYNRRRVDRG